MSVPRQVGNQPGGFRSRKGAGMSALCCVELLENKRRGEAMWRTLHHTLLALVAVALIAWPVPRAFAAPPITIGFSMSLTGGLAPNGKAALLAMQIWAENTNAKGGLLDRPIKLIWYDDQSNPALVPGIYTKLLDIDHVDLVIGAYATNIVAPAMPVIIAHNRTFLGLLALHVNGEFHYKRYFSIAPMGGPNPKQSFSAPFFAVASALKPRPETLAIVGADAQFSKNAIAGAMAIAKRDGFKVVYNQSYPPSTADFSPIVRAIQATNPDMVFVASYPQDTVGMVRAATEIGLKTKLFGGGMVGLQSTPIKMQLGPLLNGVVDYDFWLPIGSFATPDATAFLKQYQAKAAVSGVDPLGYYLPPFAYSDLQVLGDAVEGTKSLDQDKLADYLRTHTFQTIVGPIKFGPDGEWTQPRVLEVQFHGVQGHDLAQFKTPNTEAILYPDNYKSGIVRVPYQEARQ
jgi:branched-chain amino acid transport system substrate-binding protein